DAGAAKSLPFPSTLLPQKQQRRALDSIQEIIFSSNKILNLDDSRVVEDRIRRSGSRKRPLGAAQDHRPGTLKGRSGERRKEERQREMVGWSERKETRGRNLTQNRKEIFVFRGREREHT
ncbi:unnamed protein product, partial [Musa acuminata subsp. burmannicoides]